MMFLKYDHEGKVTYTHYQPFHEIYGLKKERGELEKEGLIVESIPEPEQREGKNPVLYVDWETKELYYLYEDAPKDTSQDATQKRIEQVEADLGTTLFENAMDKAKISNLETVQGEMLMEIAILKMRGI